MFGLNSKEGYSEVIKGIELKTISYGKNTLMTEVYLKKGSVLPEHAHPHEQTGYLVKGSIRLEMNGSAKIMKPGDSWNIPGNTVHKAETLEDSVAIEIFSPLREDYMKYINEKDMVL